MQRPPSFTLASLAKGLAAWVTGALLVGCATRSADVLPLPANPADFASWSCTRIDDELDLVQQRAADVAYAVDEKAGNNILALGIGVTLFWPAILAMRPDGLEAADLARLKGRFEALRAAAQTQGCPDLGSALSAQRAAALPVAVGEQLIYEDRSAARQPPTPWLLRVLALRRGEAELRVESSDASALSAALQRQDLAGNVMSAPRGALVWPHLLRTELALGQTIGGDILVVGDPLSRARMRGQVVAVGPQNIAGRRFDAAVIELFGDAQRGESYTRVEGAIVVDRNSGVLLRLDLRSAQPHFNLQRRLVQVEAAQP
jgi:hypothetical protein